MRLNDFTGIIKKHTLPLLRSYQAEDESTVFEFDIAGKNITWKAGQHGIFTLPERDVSEKKWRAFSVSSISGENTLQIATKIGAQPSSFKEALRSLNPGDTIQLRGPYGWLYLQDHNSPIVMIAGGVGITPFRAIFKELEKDNHRDVTLIYSARNTHLFQQELSAIAQRDKNIKIIYTNNKVETDTALNSTLTKKTEATYYFVSGAPYMVEDVTKALQAVGVSKKKILADSFRGY